MFAGMAELVDALDLGSSERSWGFESLYPHQEKTKLKPKVVSIFLYIFPNILGFNNPLIPLIQLDLIWCISSFDNE